jgi:hypothetical protein
MIADARIRIKSMKALNDALGLVGAERFVNLLLREPFDYTKWRQDLWADKTVEEISKAAMARRRAIGRRKGSS